MAWASELEVAPTFVLAHHDELVRGSGAFVCRTRERFSCGLASIEVAEIVRGGILRMLRGFCGRACNLFADSQIGERTRSNLNSVRRGSVQRLCSGNGRDSPTCQSKRAAPGEHAFHS